MLNKTVVFDLDGTLISIDCTQSWLAFLLEEKIEGAEHAIASCSAIMENYDSGQMNMTDYMNAWLTPIIGFKLKKTTILINKFIEKHVSQSIFNDAYERLRWHQKQGDHVAIVSASPLMIVQPIAHFMGVRNVFGIHVEMIDQHYTGKAIPPFCFKEGKVDEVNTWLQHLNVNHLDYAYSDSINDAAILALANTAYCINPNQQLQALAKQNAWQIYQWS